MDEVMISVIMGVYNTSDNSVLYKAINSILRQTFQNFEFIICDDGSTDKTYDLLCDIAKTDLRVVVIRNEMNLGLAVTLNKCIDVSRGKYIARMDADDISASNRLEKEYNFLIFNTDYAFVGCSSFLFANKGIYGKRQPIEIPSKKNFLFNSPFIHPTLMIKREAILVVKGYRSSPETKRMEDYDMFMRLYSHNFIGYNLQEFLYYYREDNQSLKKRKYRYRIDESIVRYKGFKQLNLLPQGIIYVIKPLLVGLIPQRVLSKLKKNIFY